MSAGVRSIRVARPEPVRSPEPEQAPLGRLLAGAGIVVIVAGITLPGVAFAATRSWSLTRSPAAVTGGAPASVQVIATNTGDDGGGEAVGCVEIVIPNSAFTVTGVAIDAVSDGDAWSATFAAGATETTVSIVSNSGGANRLHQAEWVAATVSFTDTGLDGTFVWTGDAFNKENCSDGFGQPHSVSVTIDGASPNTAPAAADDGYTIQEGGSLAPTAPGVLANDADPDGDAITATLLSPPSNAAGFSLNPDGSFSYSPLADWSGSDSFTYEASDGVLASGAATVTITVDPVNDPPVGVGDTYGTNEELLLTVDPSTGVLANDTDPEGDALQASIIANASHGLVLLAADGSFTYLPVLNFTGSDAFTYEVTDGSATVGPVTVDIVVGSLNDGPIAGADAYAVGEDGALSKDAISGVLSNDTDADGDVLTATLVALPAHAASFALRADGGFDYVPEAEWFGTDTFTYVADDGSATSSTATVSIDVTAVNDAPFAADDAFVTAEDTKLIVPALSGVLTNDNDADADPLDAVIVTPPASGLLVLADDGSFDYTPAANFNGTVAFSYHAADAASTSDDVTVTIDVTPVNDPPVAKPDALTIGLGDSATVDVIVNDRDVDGDPLTLLGVNQPARGSVTVVGGVVRYGAPSGFSGTTTFSYTLSDGATSVVGTVTVTVEPPAATVSPSPTPLPTPTTPPLPAPSDPPSATPSPTPAPTSSPPSSTPRPSASPTPLPEPVAPSPGDQTGTGAALLDIPEVTATLGSSSGDFAWGSLFGGFEGAFAWALPAATLGLPGLLFMIAVAGQAFGALAWIPAVRRHLGGIGLVRRQTRSHR